VAHSRIWKVTTKTREFQLGDDSEFNLIRCPPATQLGRAKHSFSWPYLGGYTQPVMKALLRFVVVILFIGMIALYLLIWRMHGWRLD